MNIYSTHDTLFEIRQGDSFNHALEIIKPFGQLDRVLAWCKTELLGEWRWQLIDVSTDQRPGRYIFYFDSERDYFAFSLYWQ
jgi:hypothetical protein